MQPPTLRTKNVVLRPHLDEDVAGIVDQCNDPQSRQYTTLPSPYTREHAEIWLRDRVRAGWQTGHYLALAVADPETNEFLGTVGLHDDGSGASAPRELGYGLRPTARGRGLAAAASRALLDWAFENTSLTAAIWRARVGNWASRRVAWSCGFQVEARVRSLSVVRGEQADGWIGSLLAADPRRPAHPWYEPVEVINGPARLREFRGDDVDDIVRGCSDPETAYWLSNLPQPYTVDDATGYLDQCAEQMASGHGVYWAVADPASDRLLGSIGIDQIEHTNGTGHVGYWIAPDGRGRGIGTAALRAVVRHAGIPVADGGLGLRRLFLRAATENSASRRVAENAGFVPVGTERRFGLLRDGRYADHVLHDILL